MEAFSSFEAVAMPFVGVNVDTDQILPARFLSKPRRGGFAQYLFYDLRFGEDGVENGSFILNRPRYRGSRILVGEENFACGSSRENAVWAIQDYGFRVVIAASFGDIFYSNSLKNGLLPIVLPAAVVASIMRAISAEEEIRIKVDLGPQTVATPDGGVSHFEIDAFSKHCLLNGVDELDYTLALMPQIDAFERRQNESPAE